MRVPLPPSVAEYERGLSAEYMRHTRYHARRLARERPSMRFTTLERADIPRSWIADVVRLNHERMASKNTESVISPRYEDGIFRVVRAHGSVTVLHDGSRVCAGVIEVLCGSEAFGWVIGHDNAYGKYRPGRLCQMAAIRHCIGRGMRTLHFLHGESQYKREVGGKGARLASYLVLRSWGSLRPGDVGRLCRRHLVRLARCSIERTDPVAQRVLRRRTPLMSIARAVSQRARRLGRR